MATPLVLAQLNSSLAYTNGGAGGTGTGTGAVRYRDGHTGGVQGALIEEGTTNYWPNGSFETGAVSPNAVVSGSTLGVTTTNPDEGVYSATIQKLAADTVASMGVSRTGGIANLVIPASSTWYMSGRVRAVGTNTMTTKLGFRFNFTDAASTGVVNGATVVAGGTWGDLPPISQSLAAYSGKTVNDLAGTFMEVQCETATAGNETAAVDRLQAEMKNHKTTYSPEFSSGTTLRTGYSFTGTANASAAVRAAAKVEVPTTLPASVAFRYRETETGAMSFGYITTLTGNNVGTYGKISHDGSDLVIESDRLLVIGPVFAFSDTLTPAERATLEATTTWTFGMALSVPSSGAVPIIRLGSSHTGPLRLGRS